MPSFLTKHAWIVENSPTILFFALWRSGLPLDQSAWVAAVAASCVLGWLRWFRRAPDTILLGINLHFALTAPTIQAVYSAGYPEHAISMIRYAGFAVPVFILITGVCLTIFTHRGFLGGDLVTGSGRKLRPALMLIWTAFACIWSYSFLGNQILSVALPVLSIFLMRRLLSRTQRVFCLLPMAMMGLLHPSELPRRALTAARSIGV